MKYVEFCEIIRQNRWSMPQLRCDVRPSNELLNFIETVGADYETFLIRYSTIQLRANQTCNTPPGISGVLKYSGEFF